jgi:type I restriction enzyme S subunit
MVTDKIIKKGLPDETSVKAGYKQTEIGVIPEDWDVKELGEILKVKHGKSQLDIGVANGKYPILATGGEIGRTNSYLYDKPSVMIGRKGTIDKPQYTESPFWTVDTLFYTDIYDNVVPKYIFYKFNTIEWYSYNEASGVPSLNAKTIEKIQISLPSTKFEQTAIATVLSDTDALIEHLGKLIAKKKAIKQGTMQQLLTGKKRLPGFSGDWEVKELREFVDFSNGKAHENFISDNGNYIVVNSKFISTEGRVAKYSNECFSPVSVDSILMVMSDVPNGKAIAKCFLVDKDDKYTVNQRICALKPKIDSKFLYYKINRNPFYLSFDDGVKQTNLKKDDVLDCKLSIPKEEPEQTAIATILSDMDAEIENLEQKRDKYEMLKQGMMQQLLTGRIRIA